MVNLDLEGNQYPNGEAAHEECHDARQFELANAVDWRQVAQIFGYDKFQRRQRGVLIAAAPDLLEEHRELWMAATQALAQLEKYDSGTADAIRQEFKRGLKRAAIAKATGDQS